MDEPKATRAKTSDLATTSYSHRGKKLSTGVYSFHEPDGILKVEIVFIHGLQLARDDFEDAYYRTWLARDGIDDNCWPMTWLPKKFPNARILSLSYDACIRRTATRGRMDAYLLGESLVQEMVDVGIGQHGCPVVFVCHCLGGLIAKQIVVVGHRGFSKDKKVCNLLRNLKGFFFYATPHGGIEVASLVNPMEVLRSFTRCTSKSPLVKFLEVMSNDVGRLNSEFEKIRGEMGRDAWRFYVIGEMLPTSIDCMRSAILVEEALARHDYPNFMGVAANHFDVCKPEDETDSRFLHLIRCIEEVLEDFDKIVRSRHVGLPSHVVGMEDKVMEVWKKMEVHSIVGLVGMGGLGKTTLSKHLYNREIGNHQFEKFCFLKDVRSRGVASCQRQLLKALCDEEWNENEDADVQLVNVQQCIVRRKVLLVVDDVATEEDLEYLQVHAFKETQKGSKVIVTTRHTDILKVPYIEAQGILDVGFLKEAEASELFSFYAFHGVNDKERMQLDNHAKNIVKACGNLPLSLEVIGKFLSKYNSESVENRMDKWVAALHRLQEAKPLAGRSVDEKLWSRLRISYDDLAEAEQSMFLDFACIICEISAINPFFRISKEWLARIWKSPDGVENLINMSLIKWNDDDEGYVMHDQLRDMGRDIVRKGKKDNENMSRIWRMNEVLNDSLQNQSYSSVEGLVLGHGCVPKYVLKDFDEEG